MKKVTGIVAAAAALCFIPISSAHAAPANPHRWVRAEAAQMGCVIDHSESLPIGPVNEGVSCHVGTQRYDVLYYRRIGHAVDWWQRFIRSGDTWIARDGLVLVIPEGSTEDGVDSGLYRHSKARYAARQLHGRVLAT